MRFLVLVVAVVIQLGLVVGHAHGHAHPHPHAHHSPSQLPPVCDNAGPIIPGPECYVPQF